MAQYLVTGGAGFIGSHIVHALQRRGEKVRVFDNFSTGKEENLKGLDIEIIIGDVRDPKSIIQSIQGVEYVFHQAALPSVALSIEEPLTSHEVNATGTLNVLQASMKAKVKRVIYASSSAIYGNNPMSPKREDLLPAPLSPYAVSKLAGEYYCQTVGEVYGLETVCLRYFNVFGPRQDPDSPYSAVIPRFICAVLDGKDPIVFGDGKQSRDFISVANVVKANLTAARSPQASGKIFNVASGKSYSLLDVLEGIEKTLKRSITPDFQEPRPGDIEHSLASVDRAKLVMSFSPEINFFDSLRKTIDWFVKSKEGITIQGRDV